MLRKHDLNLLPVFEMLIQEKHLSRAAERLNMSQPAVSNALKRLRHQYQDELFVRTGRGLSPTQRALDLHKRIGSALALIRESYEEQPVFNESYRRVVDISMNHAMEYIWGPDLMRHARGIAPNVTWKIHGDYTHDIPTRLKDGRLSFAVEYTSLPDTQYSSIVLLEESLTLICAANHRELEGEITLEQFQRLPHVSLIRRSDLVPEQNSRRTTPLEQLLGPAMPERQIALQMSSFVSIPNVVAQTDLIAVVPCRLARPLAQAGQIQTLPLPFQAPDIQLRLYWHHSRDTDPGHMWLVELLKSSASALDLHPDMQAKPLGRGI
jgi:DNA-binding transcriptional LysR family regulator